MKEETVYFDILGLWCGNCARSLERHLKKKDGIISAEVTYDGSLAKILYDSSILDISKVNAFAQELGQKAFISGNLANKNFQEEAIELDLQARFAVAFFFTTWIGLSSGLDYFTTVPMELDFYLNLLGFVFFLPILLYSAFPIFLMGLNSIKVLTINIDLVVTFTSLVSFAWSIYNLFVEKNGHVYFDSSSAIITIILLSKIIESKLKKGFVAEEIIDQTYKTIRNNDEVKLSLLDLKAGDVVILRPGDLVPASSELISESASFDFSLISGESSHINIKKSEGVPEGSRNIYSFTKIKLKKNACEGEYRNLILSYRDKLIKSGSLYKNLDSFAKYWSLSVIVLSFVAFVVNYYGFENTIEISFYRAWAVVVVACPCAILMSIPTLFYLFRKRLHRVSVHVNDVSCFEKYRVGMPVYFDKTGTLTENELRLFRYDKLGPFDDSLLSVLKHVQKELDSPFLYAFRDFPDLSMEKISSIQNIQYDAGMGVYFEFKNQKYSLVKSSLADNSVTTSDLYLEKRILARFVFEQKLRKSAFLMVNNLKQLKHPLFVLSGDSVKAVSIIAKLLNIDNYFSKKNPKEKASVLTGQEAVFVGEGLNDTLAFGVSSISFASYSANSQIQQICSVSILKDDLNLIPLTLNMMRFFKTMLNLNYFFGLSYNIVLIPLAMLGYMSPFASALSMFVSSVFLIWFNYFSTDLALKKYLKLITVIPVITKGEKDL